LKKHAVVFLLLLSVVGHAQVQPAFSILTDASLLRNLTKGQSFTTIGQSVQANFHFTKTETVYISAGYHVRGKYKNTLLATPKDTAGGVTPVSYVSSSSLAYRHFSIGWKHYFLGAFNNEESINVYSTAGFGLLAGRVENTFSFRPDTAFFVIPQQAIEGTGRFQRLTFDVSLGVEKSIAAAFFLYGELKTWLPASNFPSPYLYNNHTPQVLLLNGGVRILFD